MKKFSSFIHWDNLTRMFCVKSIVFIFIIMEGVNIKLELRTLIDQETDLNVLEAIKTLLQKAGLDSNLREKLTSRALKAEQDIVEGRVMNRQELEQKLNARLGI